MSAKPTRHRSGQTNSDQLANIIDDCRRPNVVAPIAPSGKNTAGRIIGSSVPSQLSAIVCGSVTVLNRRAGKNGKGCGGLGWQNKGFSGLFPPIS